MMKTIKDRNLPQLGMDIIKHFAISKNSYMSELNGIAAT